MSEESRLKLIRFLGYAIEILAVFVIQETPGLLPELFGARPVLLIPTALSIAMFEGETASMAFGLAAGLLMDFGYGSVLGFHAAMFAVACYLISRITANLFQTNFVTAILIAAVTTALAVLLQWTCFFVFSGYAYPFYALVNHYLPIFGYSVIFMPIAYYFNRALALQIRSKEE